LVRERGTEEEPKGVVQRAPTSVPGRVFRASQQSLREDEGGAGRQAGTHWASDGIGHRALGREQQDGRRTGAATARTAVSRLDRAYHVTARTHVNDSNAAGRRGGYSRAAEIEGPTREPRN
jgi:hypothetical protein